MKLLRLFQSRTLRPPLPRPLTRGAAAISMFLCCFVFAACFVQAADGQSRLAAPIAMFLDGAGSGTSPAPGAGGGQDTSKAPAGVALKVEDGATFGKWLGWLQYRPLAMGAGVVFTGLIILLLTWGAPSRLLLGQDNRYSNSKCQMALWFFIVISAYVTVFLVRLKSCVVGGIGIPSNLLLMSGFSAVSFAGAKAITTSKVNNALVMGRSNPKPSAPLEVAPAAAVAMAAVPGASAADPEIVAVAVVARPGVIGLRSLKNLIGDLTSNDGLKIDDPDGGPSTVSAPTLDLGDTQMIVITLVAVLAYLVTMYTYLGSTNFGLTAGVNLPDVDNTLLSLFGLGQGAYLSKKAVGNAGES